MNIEVPVVRIALHTHTIPVPYGMGVSEAWERIRLANQENRPAWPPETLIQGWVSLVVHPNGRIVGVKYP